MIRLPYRDRTDAGRQLAPLLDRYRGRTGVIVLALPRGGVPVGYEVAAYLEAPLDVFIVRKLGVPGQEELAFGAIASGGIRVLNHEFLRMARLSDAMVEMITERERGELERRERDFRGDRPFPSIEGKTLVLVDDGLATGASMLAALRAVQQRGPARVVVAVPVAAEHTCRQFGREADEIVCAATPEPFTAVGAWYEDFTQTTDEEVRTFLDRAARAGVR